MTWGARLCTMMIALLRIHHGPDDQRQRRLVYELGEVTLKVFSLLDPRFGSHRQDGLLGLLMLPIACRAEPPSDAPAVPSTHAETERGWPYCLAGAGLAAMERPAT